MSQLKKGHVASGVVAAMLIGCLSTAQAETVTDKLFESTTLVTTSTSMNLTDLNLTTAGKLVVTLKDLNWPGLLDKLSFSLTDTAHVIDTFTATSGNSTWTYTFDVSAPGTFYGSIFAKPSSTAKAGMYFANISYEHAASAPAPVPLPAAAWFLISGIAGLAAFKPKQKLSQI